MNSIFKILGLACVAVMLVGIYVKIWTNVWKEIITVNIPYCDYYWRERNGHAKGWIVENTCSFRNPDQW
jgi:hypothetical protein